MQAAKLPAKTLPRIRGSHEMEWVHACKEGRAADADFAYSGPLTEICLLGNVAKRVNSRILWDAENLKITNLPEANKYVRTEYRTGWSLSHLRASYCRTVGMPLAVSRAPPAGTYFPQDVLK